MRAAVRRAVLALALCLNAAQAQVDVSIESADLSRGPGLMLKGFWFEAAASGPAPAVVLLHGCDGPYDTKGLLSVRTREYAALLNRAGLHALVLDSLTPRGEKQICTQRNRVRLITQAHRRLDALAALDWLAEKPEVDASRLGLLGWSHGGSAVLAVTNERHEDLAGGHRMPSFGVAFYPGCEAELRRGYESHSRVLLLLGEADDWTPAAPCRRLAARAQGRTPEIESYPGAHHGFDSTLPVRLRADVPNGLNPGKGVHVGGNVQALQRSRERLMRFLGEVTAPPR